MRGAPCPDTMTCDPPSFAMARTVISTLVGNGVQHFCVCPGSRSTALALCSWLESSSTVTAHHDERSAGFMALGMALRTQRPTAVITTSGTAAAELLPAAMEAYQSQVPLVLLTADRPVHLHGTGSNQTVRQAGLFGYYVKGELDLAPVAAASLALAATNIRETIADLMMQCREDGPGPVHLNIQLEKPFEPARMAAFTAEAVAAEPPAEALSPRLSLSRLENLQALLARSHRGLVIVGPNRYARSFAEALHALARTLDMPVLADPLSGCRFCGTDPGTGLISGYEALLQTGHLDGLRPDLVLRFGSLPVSTRLTVFLQTQLPAGCPHIYVNPTGCIHDETGAVTHYVRCHPVWFCRTLSTRLTASDRPSAWTQHWTAMDQHASRTVHAILSRYPAWDGAYAAALLQCLPARSMLMAGNSLPVRLLDLVGHPSWTSCQVYGNRGASGIDGVVSTAMGLAYATGEPVVLLLGDVSLLHDIGGLAAVRQQHIDNIVIVVLNNNGGGIFEHLPAARMGAPFEQLFITPHGMTFATLAQAFGLQYAVAESPDRFRTLMHTALASRQAFLLEVMTDRQQDVKQAQHFISNLEQGIRIQSHEQR